MMKTEKVKTKEVFKDMNNTTTAVSQGKKLAVGIKTEAFGDKENVVKKTKVLYDSGDSKLPEFGESTKEKVKLPELGESTKEKTKSLELAELTKEKKKACDESNETAKKITAEDLISNPGEIYWKTLAEKRLVALQEALDENSTLHQKVALLQEENSTLKQALAEATDVIDVLNEIVNEKSGEGEEEESHDFSNESNVQDGTSKDKSPKAFEDSTILDDSDSSIN